ncbi:hypothetical protein DXG01_001110 [Tephrocybe rancida]|nr:hypothetical protein DXG01_001110 [Tephrocybe rancida]
MSSRADDTKGMKPAVIDWITPPNGHLDPPIKRHHKTNRGFHHEVTGGHLCPAGLNWDDADIKSKLGSGEKIVAGHHWPIFIYADSTFDPDDPWKGLLRSDILVKVNRSLSPQLSYKAAADTTDGSITTKSGNAKIHGMKKVTRASIVYVATQVRFALTSASQWSRSDKVTDSENFYTSLLDVLENPIHNDNSVQLLVWWDSKIFPHHIPEATLVPVEGSPLDRIRQMAAQGSANSSQR